MRLLPDSGIIPALMFHSVGLEKYPWIWSHLSESVQVFEEKIKAFKRWGYTGVHWNDVYEHMSGKKLLAGKSIFLTFDDGYLDNWVFVYPVLKKYGMKGTIFVSTDFVDPLKNKRLNLDDVWKGHASMADLQPAGFLNWSEMKAMLDSGIIDIQSHSKTHTWYFSGLSVVDFHLPAETYRYPWLFWNAKPDRKPYYLTEKQQSFVPWGYPILEHGKSLDSRRFFPDTEALNLFLEYADVKSNQDNHASRVRLTDLYKSRFGNDGLPGLFETDAECEARKLEELVGSKQILEQHLDKKVEYICWPGGGYDTKVIELAQKAGYKAWTLGSRDNSQKRNKPASDPCRLKRIGTSNHIRIKGRGKATGGAVFQMLKVLSHQNSILYSLLLHLYKISALTFKV